MSQAVSDVFLGCCGMHRGKYSHCVLGTKVAKSHVIWNEHGVPQTPRAHCILNFELDFGHFALQLLHSVSDPIPVHDLQF